MQKFLGWMALGAIAGSITTMTAAAEQPLHVAYPPNNHETTAQQIFLIGTAPAQGEVRVNGQVIRRSSAGHFAPSFPLQVGENTFTLRYQGQTGTPQELQITVNRRSTAPVIPTGLEFGSDSLTPAVNIARMPGELICFSAIAPPRASVSVKLGNQTIPLQPPAQNVQLPPNSAVLTQRTQPVTAGTTGRYEGCTAVTTPGNLGQPQFQLTLQGQTKTQAAPGNVTIFAPGQLEIIEVTAESGVARTGPSTDHSRLTPLPQRTQATVTAQEGDWLRLDYGGWIRRSETRTLTGSVPPRSLIRSARSRQIPGWTEVVFPLQVPVPVSIQEGDRTFTLTLHNTTAQTDIIRLDDDPVISRLDWYAPSPNQVQYTFNLKSAQQWGYKLRYEGTSLILSLRHPPAVAQRSPARPLAGMRILLDPGHGSSEDLGARGPTGYPEKDVTLTISKLVQTELTQRGATVIMTREGDDDLYPQDRINIINQQEPAIALSLHYNALPDDGDAEKTQGLSAFWYNPQAHSLAVFLHNYLVQKLNRPSYGVFWNNLALTRPTVAPAVMLELGFMIHPEEFEWIINPQAQKQLAAAIADGIVEWASTNR